MHAPLFEALTALNLSRSQKSQTCPACGHPKKANAVFCDECRAMVPASVLEPLMKARAEGTAEEQQRKMYAAFVALGVNTWHPPQAESWAGAEDTSHGKRTV